jgi:putative transposase
MKWQPKKLSRGQLAERRKEGFKLLGRGKLMQKEVAEQLGVREGKVSCWNKVLKEEGMRGAKARVSSGRPAKLGPEQRKVLVRLLKRGAVQAGYSTERWIQQRIQKVVEQEFGVTYHPNYLGRLLDQLGWSVQTPSRSTPRNTVMEL